MTCYCCDDCGFLFVRTGAVEQCPSCEGYRFRPATQEENDRLQALLKKPETSHETGEE